MKKPTRCGEVSFLLGVVVLGFGTALMRLSGLGMSMVVAPAYVLSAWIGVIPAGTMCYICQGVLIVVTSIMMRRFRVTYLFSFLSAVLFGLSVDFFAQICFPGVHPDTAFGRVVLFVPGLLTNSLGIAMLFHTYFPPQAPELFVKELAGKRGLKLYKVKYGYDLCSCALSIALSFLLLGKWDFSVIGAGTVVCAFLNGPLIGLWGKGLDRIAGYDAAFTRLGAIFENN